MMSIVRLVLALAAAVLIAGPAATQSFKMEVIHFPSDPPGKVRKAPGSGRLLTPAVLFTPSEGANVRGPAIVMLDAGPGAHPLEQGQATRFAAERLAARGYTVLSLYGLQEHEFPTVPFEETVWAVDAALDHLELSGYEDFILAGQGYGAIVAARYLETQPDILLDNGEERRVKALIVINPLTNLRAFPRANLGSGYEAKVAAARRSVETRRGLYPSGALEPGRGGGDAADPWVAAGPFVAPAEGFLDLWGPEAEKRNLATLAKVSLPTLALISGQDPTTSRRLVTAAKPEIVRFPRDRGDFAGSEDRAAGTMANWLKRRELGVQPRVTTSILDVRTAGGRMLQGIRYEPGGSAKANAPLIMLIGGRTADTIQSSTHWMGWRLAQKGYSVIAPGLRISGVAGFQSSNIAEVAHDVKLWVDRAQAIGARRVVLAGHSNGGIWLSNYLSVTQDPRVVGTVYFAPTRDSPTYAAAQLSPEAYRAQVAGARASAAAGRDLEDVIGFMTVRAYLDNNAPGSRAMHTHRVREFSLPGLAIIGRRDPLMSPDFVKEFARAYRGKLDVVEYQDGSHGFRENKDRLVADVDKWMTRSFR
jgi:pimeloyl-ACP methyl ester carboxylesterase